MCVLTRFVLCAGLVPILAACAAPGDSAAPATAWATPEAFRPVAFMVGHWYRARTGEEGQRHSEEVWLPPRGGAMLGVNRSARDEPARASWEWLRIERDEAGLVYWAEPVGQAPTPFRLRASGEGWVEFRNPDHDFPKLLRYEATVDKGEPGLRATATGSGSRGPMRLEFDWRASSQLVR